MIGKMLESSTIQSECIDSVVLLFKDKLLTRGHRIAARCHMNYIVVLGWEKLLQ